MITWHRVAESFDAAKDIAAVKASAPGGARYISTLEYGHTLYELTFGLLFLAVVLFVLRCGQRWCWFACWAVMIASIGYSATFGAHDSTILGRSLIADVGVRVLLLLAAPAVFGRTRPGAVAPERTLTVVRLSAKEDAR